MAKAIPNPEPPQNRFARQTISPAPARVPAAPGPDDLEGPLSNLGLWAAGHTPVPDLEETRSDTPDLLSALGGGLASGESEQARQVEALTAENAKLRTLATELRKEAQALIREKDELIDALEARNHELEEVLAAKKTPKEEELVTMSEELERERCQLQQEQRELQQLRQRLGEDEKDMQQQMRDTEVQMARERADFARRRNELQRILEEIRRELDKVERNGHLNQRLVQLRQRFQDVAT